MFILDASATLPWCFSDEATADSEALLARLRGTKALVPPIWPLEIANTLIVAERRGRLTQAKATHFLGVLRALPIMVDDGGAARAWEFVLQLARETGLSVHDASYLDLAMLRGLPLAALDARLIAAAARLGVALLR